MTTTTQAPITHFFSALVIPYDGQVEQLAPAWDHWTVDFRSDRPDHHEIHAVVFVPKDGPASMQDLFDAYSVLTEVDQTVKRDHPASFVSRM